MKSLVIQLEINNNLYLKDPQDSKLGRRIIEQSVILIDELGLEQFNFKKLAKYISSTEASIYRYFENKHQLFVYLLNWYWEWMTARIKLNTMNIADPRMKLRVALGIIIDTANRNMDIEFVDEEVLHRIVVREGANAYHNKLVDKDNATGYFLAYKNLSNHIASLIVGVDKTFKYPKALASTLIETANNNLYFAKHLPRLTDLKDDKSLNKNVKSMVELFCFGLLDRE